MLRSTFQSRSGPTGRRYPFRLRWLLAGVPLASMAMGLSASGLVCVRSTGTQPPAVVELYTSEGCSSCPPADRWLTSLQPQDGVLALGFHVSYWNHLGWRDRFASAETTARQHRIREALGARYVYTPQVLVNGDDVRGWRRYSSRHLPRLPADAAPALTLSRRGDEVMASVRSTPGQGVWRGTGPSCRTA